MVKKINLKEDSTFTKPILLEDTGYYIYDLKQLTYHVNDTLGTECAELLVNMDEQIKQEQSRLKKEQLHHDYLELQLDGYYQICLNVIELISQAQQILNVDKLTKNKRDRLRIILKNLHDVADEGI